MNRDHEASRLYEQLEALRKRIEFLEVQEKNRFTHIATTDGITAPSTISGFALIYVDTADGDLKVKFGDGTVKTIVTDT